MRLRCTLWLGLLAGLLFLSPAVHAEPSRAKLGQKIPNLTFRDDQGNEHRLHDLKDQKAIVLAFLSFECPVSNSYAAPLTDVVKEMGKYGVTVWGLTVNEDDTAAQVAKQARDFNLNFPVFRDAKLRAAEAVDATVTPEVFVLDGDFVLRYRGRIDDAYSERLKKHAVVSRHDLRQVLAELMTGRPVSVSATQSVGCLIPRDEKAPAAAGAVTYHRDVLPILQAHCQSCHRPGEVGPFSLLTYKQAVNWADDIKTYTQNRQMPPWKVAAGVRFHNERALPEKDLKTLAAWVDGGTPAGDPKDAPPAKTFPQGWQLGTPDLVLTVQDDFVLGPTGGDRFRCFVLPTNLPDDVYVSAVEVRPGNPRVVHHVLNFLDTTGAARKLEQAEREKKKPADGHGGQATTDRGPGYTVNMGVGFTPTGGLTGWAPGLLPRYLPDGVGFRLPKGADVVMQVHYHRNGREEKDRTQVGLYFAKKPVDRPHQSGTLAGRGKLGPWFLIPAGAERFVLTGEKYATDDFTLFSVTPHMHMLGKEITVTMTPPDGQPETLIRIGDWDYNWQEMYLLKEPIRVKAGTKFHVEAVYDNSAKNPRNPSTPPRPVTFGEQTTNEMCFVFLGGYSNLPRRGLPLSPTAPKKDAVKTAAGR